MIFEQQCLASKKYENILSWQAHFNNKKDLELL
jgi:hypothetical protein